MDKYLQKRLFSNRVAIVTAVLLAVVAAIVVNLFDLQIVNHDYYRTLAEGNRFKLAPAPAPRGLIYDRNGKPLAINKTVHSLELTPALIDDLPATLKQIGSIIGLKEEDIERFHRKRKKTADFQSVVLRAHLNDTEVAKLAVSLHRLDGVEITGRVVRYYPYHGLFSHLAGHVGLLSEQDMRRIDYRNYRAQQYIGKTGIEKSYEETLHGKIGFRKIEVNAKGRPIRTVDEYKALPGHDLLLAADSELQQAAFDALGEYSGAVVMLDSRNGDVLALVSRPSFDPNLFSYSFSNDDYRALRSNRLKPFFNRAISGQYPPGSTIKPIIALAALEQKVVSRNRRMFAGPHYILEGSERHYRDWRKEGHGWVNLSDSITQSCDVFFYDTAHKMGINMLSHSLRRFGLGQKTGIDMPSEPAGLVPTPEWKNETLGEPWLPAETIITGIGQGYTLTTPLQMAVATSAIANRGRGVVPRLVKAIHDGKEWQEQPVRHTEKVQASDAHWDYVVDAMRRVVHEPNGTAYRINAGLDYAIAGKTGTMQLISMADEEDEREQEEIEKHLVDHGMFIAFAPIDEPEVALVVLSENSGSGAIAASIAREILDAYFETRAPIAANTQTDERDVSP